MDAVRAALVTAYGVDAVAVLPDERLNELLRPWLGADMKTLALPVPGVIILHLTGEPARASDLGSQLAKLAPGTTIEHQAVGRERLLVLSRALRLCAGLVLIIVTLVAVAVTVMAARGALLARREIVMIVSRLGATDKYIARRFSGRVAMLTARGGLIGGVLALPVVFALTVLAAPLAGTNMLTMTPAEMLAFPPLPLWMLPVIAPPAAAVIGYVTAQITLFRWLRQNP